MGQVIKRRTNLEIISDELLVMASSGEFDEYDLNQIFKRVKNKDQFMMILNEFMKWVDHAQYKLHKEKLDPTTKLNIFDKATLLCKVISSRIKDKNSGVSKYYKNRVSTFINNEGNYFLKPDKKKLKALQEEAYRYVSPIQEKELTDKIYNLEATIDSCKTDNNSDVAIRLVRDICNQIIPKLSLIKKYLPTQDFRDLNRKVRVGEEGGFRLTYYLLRIPFFILRDILKDMDIEVLNDEVLIKGININNSIIPSNLKDYDIDDDGIYEEVEKTERDLIRDKNKSLPEKLKARQRIRDLKHLDNAKLTSENSEYLEDSIIRYSDKKCLVEGNS